jgi:hypothetical protein
MEEFQMQLIEDGRILRVELSGVFNSRVVEAMDAEIVRHLEESPVRLVLLFNASGIQKVSPDILTHGKVRFMHHAKAHPVKFVWGASMLAKTMSNLFTKVIGHELSRFFNTEEEALAAVRKYSAEVDPAAR